MREVIEKAHERASNRELVRRGFVSGISWAFGVSLGFVLVSFLLVAIVNLLGGLPLIGKWIADLVSVTQVYLNSRTPGY